MSLAMEWRACRVGIRQRELAVDRLVYRLGDLELKAMHAHEMLAAWVPEITRLPRHETCAYLAALCAEGIAPELDLLPMPESPDVSAVADRLLAAWRTQPTLEIVYRLRVQTWLRAHDRVMRWIRALHLLAKLQGWPDGEVPTWWQMEGSL